MPMVFAFRIVDCFFCMGPKVLFQVGYVISCPINEEMTSANVVIVVWVSIIFQLMTLLQHNLTWGYR
jgi:hypothetical protein